MTPFSSNSIVISIVLGSYNRKAFLISTIENVRNNQISVPYEIIVIDGGSTDGSMQWLLKQKDIITIIQHNRGTFKGKKIERKSWGHFMNLGFKAAKGKYILMISDDCLLVPGAVMNGYNYTEQILNSGRKIGAVAFYWRNWPVQNNFWVGLAYGKLFVNHGFYMREALEDVGWIDETNYHFYHADSDVGLKMWDKGYEIITSPDSYVEHFIHANKKIRSTNFVTQPKDWENYLNKWKELAPKDGINHPEWLEKEYNDVTNTYTQFPIFERLKYKYLDSKESFKLILKKRLSKTIIFIKGR